MQDIQKKLISIFGQENVKINEPMSKHTTFRIGGQASYFVTPDRYEDLQDAVKFLKENNISYEVIGNGSNLLVADGGYPGVIFDTSKNLNSYRFICDESTSAIDKTNKVYVTAQAGCMMSRLGNEFAKNSLSGFEFATGIPGTIGGAVVMNAGAYGGEIKDILVSATVIDNNFNIVTLSRDELNLSYRNSIIKEKGYIVLETVIALEPGNESQIREKIADLSNRRKEKQPLEYPSAGSTFKRPEGYFAGKLISDAGLKGFSVGGAQVSDKHAGFVINTGNATALDVISLTDAVKEKVSEIYNVELELEIKKIGF